MARGASGQLLREHTQNCFLVCLFRASASATCSYATSPAESCRIEIVPQARMECSQQAETRPTQDKCCYGRGGLRQRLNDVQSRVGATATRAHVESPLRTELFVDSCSVRHQGTAARTHAKSPPLGSPCAHKAQRDVHATSLLRSHATSTLGSLSVRKEPCSGERTAAFSRRKHTWISFRAQRKQTRSCDNTAAFAHCEPTWTSLGAQRDMFRRKVAACCCVLTPRAHLDLAPCANRHVPSKDRCVLTPHAHLDLSPCASKKTRSCDRLLRSHATSTLGWLSVRKETCSGEKVGVLTPRAHLDLAPCAKIHVPSKNCCDLALHPKIDGFYLRTPDPVSTIKRTHVPCAIGNP